MAAGWFVCFGQFNSGIALRCQSLFSVARTHLLNFPRLCCLVADCFCLSRHKPLGVRDRGYELSVSVNARKVLTDNRWKILGQIYRGCSTPDLFAFLFPQPRRSLSVFPVRLEAGQKLSLTDMERLLSDAERQRMSGSDLAIFHFERKSADGRRASQATAESFLTSTVRDRAGNEWMLVGMTAVAGKLTHPTSIAAAYRLPPAEQTSEPGKW